jgi:transposase
MRREYGWAARGLRATGTRPGRTWKTLSLIGAMRLGERPRLMVRPGAVNGRVFVGFIRTRLAAMLRPGDFVVMDNLSVHKTAAVRAAIEETGATIRFLPAYSPELNPIELWWGDIKRHLRTLAIDTQRELASAIRTLRASLPLDKIAGWFRLALREAHFN